MPIALKRAYEKPSRTDGTRILVERLWPRGVSKEAAAVDHWVKDAAPSTELRRWFDHDASKWQEFKRRYHAELKSNPEVIEPILECVVSGHVTFVFSSREECFNSAVALKEYVEALGGQ